MSQQILDKLTTAIEGLDAGAAEAAAKEAISSKVDLQASLEALAKGMDKISDAFDEGEVFIPQLILAGKAFEGAAGVLTANLSAEEKKASSKGRILVHTVSGDIHSIGKNICAVMLKASGFEVIDAGVDVPVDAIVQQAQDLDVDIILGSALMTTTMPAQREIVALLKEKGLEGKFCTMFGGAPTSKDWCDEIGADGWSDTAPGAVRVATEFMNKKKGA